MRLPTVQTIWVVDDDPILLDALQLAFRRQGWPVETFQTASQVLHRLQTDVPGCLIVDLQLGDDNGLALIQLVRESSWPAPALLMSGHLNIQLTVHAMRGGASLVLEKPFTLAEMCRETAGLLEAGAAALEQCRRQCEARQSLNALPDGQRAVLHELVQCRPQKQIASRLGIALRTVEKRKREVFDRLRVKTFTELLELVQLAERPL